MDLEHFDIANYSGHKALDELYYTYSIYVNPIGQVLRALNIQVQYFDAKGKSDINTILETKTILELNIDNIDHINCFHVGSALRTLRKKEAEFCINTAIFFQSMMEAEINHLINLYNISFDSRNPSFKIKWEKFLEDNNAPQSIRDSFTLYLNNIYKGIRIPAVHPSKRMGLENPDLLRFANVHKNIMHGWFVFVFAQNIVHNATMDYDENWNHMCQVIHHIPSTIDNESFIDIEKLSGDMSKKHLDTLNKNR